MSIIRQILWIIVLVPAYIIALPVKLLVHIFGGNHDNTD